MRDDIRGRRAPAALAKMLLRLYGRTPFGEPRYRLVWAPSRLERAGGLWRDWPAGMTTEDKLTGRALSERLEMRQIPKYPGEECWLIEAWHGPEKYGTPELWYKPQADGGTVLVTHLGSIAALGDYPSLGDYEDIGARMYWAPTELHLTTAIGAYERGLNAARSGLAAARARERAARAAEAENERLFDAEADAVLSEGLPAFHGAPFVGAGPKQRSSVVEAAERIGIREHPF